MSATIEVWDGAKYVPFGGVPGPTAYMRLGGTTLTPRAAGDLIADPNVASVDWDTGWIYPAFQNGWDNYNPSTHVVARYRKSSGNLVICEGLIKGTAMNTIAFQFAQGYRPAHWIITSCLSTDNAVNNRLDITNGGNLRPVYGNAAWASIQCMFYADL